MLRMAVAVAAAEGGEAQNRCAMWGNSCAHKHTTVYVSHRAERDGE